MSHLRIPLRRPEIAWRVIDGEAVVVNPKAGLVYPFNPAATRCWELSDGNRSLAEIASCVAEEFDAPQEQILLDLTAFVDELFAKGLMENCAAGLTEGVHVGV